MEAASFAFPSGSRIAVGQISAVLAIDKLLVTFQFPTNCTRGALEGPGNISVGPAAYAKFGDVVPFFMRELSIATHV